MVRNVTLRRAACAVLGLAACGLALLRTAPAEDAAAPGPSSGPARDADAAVPADSDRSPVDLLLTPDEQWLVTANQSSSTLSLVRAETGQVTDEIPCGRKPAALALTPDGRRFLATGTFGGDLRAYEIQGERLVEVARLRLGFEPYGIAVSPDGAVAYVALAAAGEVAVVDLTSFVEVGRIAVGPWPRHVAVSPDGTRLAVATNGDRSMAVVDAVERKLLYKVKYEGLNSGQMEISPDGQYVYFPWVIYRQNPINERNIRLGWVLATRIARIRLDGPARREAISLDVPGKAVSDPHGLALTGDGGWLVASGSGTHELLVYRLPDLPFQGAGGPGDLIDPPLMADPNRFYRIDLGGRPMALRASRDDRHVYVANYLSNCVQVVDLRERVVARTIPLGGPEQPSLARQGEAIFFDARRSLDQWYSCQTCHWEGGTNAVAIDTHNDGSDRTFKTVLSLHHVTETAPWTWHGWQQDLEASLAKSMTETMLGPTPTAADLRALTAYLETLQRAPNPYRDEYGNLSPAAERGRLVFESAKAGCAECHGGPLFTDGRVHDVGLGSESDVYQGFNTPSLLGVFNRPVLLHHGRAKSLEQLLTEFHNPREVTGMGELTDEERSELIEYVKSL